MDSEIILPPDYKPSADEEYMNEYQVEYFRQKLLSWKNLFWNSPRIRWKICARAD